ncbi:MAG: nucleotidyltransferase domain-containing protein [Promethearchaeota archaeon]
MKIEEIENIFKEIFLQNEEIIAVYLYGSFLYSDNYEDVDIGLLIRNNFKPNIMYEAELAGKLEQIFKDTNKGFKPFDVRILNGKPLRFLFSLLKNSKIIYSKKDLERVKFETKIMKEYLDFKPHHEMYDNMRRLRYADR